MTEQEPIEVVNRNELIEQSRRRFKVSRAEAEDMVAEQMGWPNEEELRRARVLKLRNELMSWGVSEIEAESLLTRYSANRIEQQLAWLPYRAARKPSALIVAAIKHNYEPPAAVLGGQDGSAAASSSQPSSEGPQRP